MAPAGNVAYISGRRLCGKRRTNSIYYSSLGFFWGGFRDVALTYLLQYSGSRGKESPNLSRVSAAYGQAVEEVPLEEEVISTDEQIRPKQLRANKTEHVVQPRKRRPDDADAHQHVKQRLERRYSSGYF